MSKSGWKTFYKMPNIYSFTQPSIQPSIYLFCHTVRKASRETAAIKLTRHHSIWRQNVTIHNILNVFVCVCLFMFEARTCAAIAWTFLNRNKDSVKVFLCVALSKSWRGAKCCRMSYKPNLQPQSGVPTKRISYKKTTTYKLIPTQ